MERNKLVLPTVVSVSRKGLVLCGKGVPGLLQLPFPETLLRDLGVTDLSALTTQVKTFIEANHIKPSDLIVVLNNDVCFEKLLGETIDSQGSQQVQDFVDSVPLSNPTSKVFKINNKYHVVVINRHLYESVRLAFEDIGFRVVAVVPEIVLGQIGKITQFDENACRLILGKMDFIRENNFVASAHDPSENNLVNQNKGLALGLSVGSMVLALTVVGVFTWQVTQTKKAAIARIKARAAEQAVVTPTPELILVTPAQSQTSYSLLFRNVPATISSQLKLLGFSNITEDASIAGQPGTVSFLQSVPTEIREKIVNVLRNYRADLKVLQPDNDQFDINITL